MFPGHKIVPSQSVVTIRQDAREPVRKLSTMRRGLLPSRAKDMSIGNKTINARAEAVATTPSFRGDRSSHGVASFRQTDSTNGSETARRTSRTGLR